MDKQDRIKHAHSLHMDRRYNCAQAVACTFADILNMDEKDIFRAAEAFGLGMGVMGTCGAVSGMAIVIGLLESDGNIDNPATKRNCYKLMSACHERFREKNSTVICRELKGIDTGKVIRSCNDCIGDAVEILCDILNQENN
ncbi:MAG: C-GCAxxG-C-C family protein [Eubacteriales bacterium]|nr:C-GCAxxG-C-C family protein [Eubacteriales bacterium]